MHNPTRRAKRFKRPLTSYRVDTSNEDGHATYRVPHYRTPDAIRGVMFALLVVVTVVLYVTLWELKRSSFIAIPKTNRSRVTEASSNSTYGLGQESDLSVTSLLVQSESQSAAPTTRIPKEDSATKETDERIQENDNATTPMFLFPVRIGEQESKARLHLTQLLLLARRLNRTLVLPNVGNSRMNLCSEWPFAAYYDDKRLASESRLTVDLENFIKWLDGRPTLPKLSYISTKSIPGHRGADGPGRHTIEPGPPFIVDEAETDPKSVSCLESKLARLRSSLPDTTLSISFPPGSLKSESDVSSQFVRLLSNDTDSDRDLVAELGHAFPYTSDVDVLFLDYDLRHPLFRGPIPPELDLHYAPALYDLADRLADALGPFLGVHWRMEHVPVQNLAWCAASLVSTLHAHLRDKHSIRHVWLATDHPRPVGAVINGLPEDAKAYPMRKSSTFKVVSSEHDDAIGMLVDAFQPGGDLDAWILADLTEQVRRFPYIEGKFNMDEALLNDPGILGILDKLVITQATVFISGSADCSKTSSFSKQVADARQATLEAKQGKESIHNVVDYFGKW